MQMIACFVSDHASNIARMTFIVSICRLHHQDVHNSVGVEVFFCVKCIRLVCDNIFMCGPNECLSVGPSSSVQVWPTP